MNDFAMFAAGGAIGGCLTAVTILCADRISAARRVVADSFSTHAAAAMAVLTPDDDYRPGPAREHCPVPVREEEAFAVIAAETPELGGVE